jgi:hypothetical protein
MCSPVSTALAYFTENKVSRIGLNDFLLRNGKKTLRNFFFSNLF